MRLEVEQVVTAPRDVVWEVLTAWERQPEWMLDAKSVHVLTPVREGVGVTIRCPTNLLGVTVADVMRVTGWDPPSRLEVTHLGRVITGSGAFELTEAGRGTTRIVWWEEITPPFGRIGEWGASRLALPVLERVFSQSLRRLGGLVAAEAQR